MSLNKVMLIGRVGKDVEVRYMTNGDAVANLTLATSEKWKDKQGQSQEKTEWHALVIYRRLAEVAGEYLKKGSQIYIEGKLQTRKYQTKDGQDRYTTEIVVNEMQMLGSRNSGESRPPASGGGAAAAPVASAPSAAPSRTGGGDDGAFAGGPVGWDDDIPYLDTSVENDVTFSKASGCKVRSIGRC